MGSIISAISDDIDSYVYGCNQLNIKTRVKDGQAACYSDHAQWVEDRLRIKNRLIPYSYKNEALRDSDFDLVGKLIAKSPDNKIESVFRNYRFKNGQKVWFNNPGVIAGVGVIVGVATTEQPVMGRLWIVEVKVSVGSKGESLPNDEYPFKTITMAECHIVEQTK